MDEQVQEWVKKKLQAINAGENVLSQSTPEEPESTAISTAEPVQEEPKKPEKKIAVDKEIKHQPEVKHLSKIKRQPETEQPINGSVDVENKISEYVQKVVDAENSAVEKPIAKNPAVGSPGVIDEQQPKAKAEQQPRVKDGLLTGEPKHSEKSSMLKIPKLFGHGLGLFTNRKLLILIVSSVAGVVAGYLVFLFLII